MKFDYGLHNPDTIGDNFALILGQIRRLRKQENISDVCVVSASVAFCEIALALVRSNFTVFMLYNQIRR